MSEPRSLPGPARPAPALRVAPVVLVLEGLAAAGYGVYVAFQTNSARLVVGLGAGLLLLGYGIALFAIARGLWRHRRWSRGPATATQLIQLPLAWSFRTGETSWVGALMGLAAVIALVCLFLPSSTAALIAREDRTESS